MATSEELRQGARAVWASGDWDRFSRVVEPVGARVLERIGIEPGMDVLDVGTGSGGNVAIPAARGEAKVVGSDLTPELFEHARRRAAEAGVEVDWVEADAQELPFADAAFDRVISTFGAMFAPDHTLAASELVRVCRPGGRIAMTTWINDGFAGETFKLSGAFMPAPPPEVQPPPLWGIEAHVNEVFDSVGVTPRIERERVTFDFPTVGVAVQEYADDFGPFVVARAVLEPQGRWDEFLEEFAAIVRRFNKGGEEDVQIASDYFLITVDR